MRKMVSRIATAAMAAALLAFAPLSSVFAAEPPPAADAIVAGKAEALVHGPLSQVLGNPNGDVTIVEFFDYACPYCKVIEPKLIALLKADKNVKLVIKEFPILTPASMVATRVAFAAAKQGKYGQFHQALMLRKGNLNDAAIYDTAKSVGLNAVKMRRDMAAPEIADAVIFNLNLARSLRVFQTPTIIVDNHILTGPSGEIDFAAEVARARAKR